MLNPKANTVISQSFIASEFQGYTDYGPTSSLNQFVKSKPMHQSGIGNEQKQTFGFDSLNKTTPQQPVRLQSVSRQVIEAPKYTMSKTQEQPNVNAHYQSSNQISNNQGGNNQRLIQGGNQQYANQQNFSLNNFSQPQTNSPVKMQKQRYVSPNIVKMQTPKIEESKFDVNNSSNYNETNYASNNQSDQFKRGGNSYQQESGMRQTSSQGRKFKMNISQQFSNSFTLKNVNQPQRSNIKAMKNRARQYRKSIQNYII